MKYEDPKTHFPYRKPSGAIRPSHFLQIRLYVPAVPFGTPQSGTDEQLRRRRRRRRRRRQRQQLTSFDFTDRLTRLYRNIRSIPSIYSKYSCLIRAKHIIEQNLLIYLSRRIPRAPESPTESCLLCCTVRNSSRQKHPTSSVRSCLKRREREKKRSEKKKKKVHDEVGIPRFCTREERDMGNLPRSVNLDRFIS